MPKVRSTVSKTFRQPAEKRIRVVEEWHCDDGHDFGFDPDKGPAPTYCPYIVGQHTNGKFIGCSANVRRVKAAGVLKP